ncbi:MAG: hypothetical protein ACLU8J_11425 [Acutalibacter sp.]
MLTPGAKGAAPDRRVLVALPGEKNRAQWERLLGEEGFREVAFAASGGEARRLLLGRGTLWWSARPCPMNSATSWPWTPPRRAPGCCWR